MNEQTPKQFTDETREGFAGLEECDYKDRMYELCDLVDKLYKKIKELEAEIKRLKDRLKWLANDMSYKPPEMMFEMVYKRWIPYIQEALDEKQND